MAVMTISRELESEGVYIARKVAQGLGYHFVDKDATENATLLIERASFRPIESEPLCGPSQG